MVSDRHAIGLIGLVLWIRHHSPLEQTVRKNVSLLAAVAAAALFLSAGTAAAATPAAPTAKSPVLLTDGLVGPLHLSAGTDGSVTVSEEFAGRLTHVDSDGNKKVLYEAADWDIAGNAQRHGSTYFLESQGAGPGDQRGLVGHIRIIDDGNHQRTVGDFAALETAENADGGTIYGFRDLPDGCAVQLPPGMPAAYKGEVDSHPYGIAVTGRTIYVADAGANSVVSVDAGSGTTKTIAVLPPRPLKITAEVAASNGLPPCVVGTTYDFESVPTDVAVGADGWLYVTSLPGGPEDPALGARGAIFKVQRDGDDVKLLADEIMSPTGLVVNDDGELYVASLFGQGVLKIDAESGGQTVVLAASLTADVALRGHTLYATVNALGSSGQVMYVKLDHGSN